MKHNIELRDHPAELHKFRIRLVISAGFVLILFLVLYIRFYYLQVTQQEHYHTLAEANRISISPLVPNRGLIYDRNGRVLAQNYSAYTLEIVPSKFQDLEATLDELATVIEITPTDRQRFKKLMKESKKFKSLPIRNRLTDVEIASFAANRYRFPGIEIKARVLRQYPEKEIVSHVVGYISRINDKDLEQLEFNGELNNYRGSHHIGKIGIEQSYEKQLHGISGFEEVETDAIGRSIRVLSRTPPVPGNNLTFRLILGYKKRQKKPLATIVARWLLWIPIMEKCSLSSANRGMTPIFLSVVLIRKTGICLITLLTGHLITGHYVAFIRPGQPSSRSWP